MQQHKSIHTVFWHCRTQNEECALSTVAAVAGINIKSFNILDTRGKVFSSTLFIVSWGVDGSSYDWLQKHFNSRTSCSKQSVFYNSSP